MSDAEGTMSAGCVAEDAKCESVDGTVVDNRPAERPWDMVGSDEVDA